MNSEYALVVGRIEQELANLARILPRIEQAVHTIQGGNPDQDFYLDSIALNLHGFYAGVEKILQYIATKVDHSVPKGTQWHRELLNQMNVAAPPIRPAVLSTETVLCLDEYLRFRHVVRNIYTFQFAPARLMELATGVTPCFERLKTELLAFAELLSTVNGKVG